MYYYVCNIMYIIIYIYYWVNLNDKFIDDICCKCVCLINKAAWVYHRAG